MADSLLVEALKNWVTLNQFVKDATEKECEELLEMELEGRARKLFVNRIHSRLNKVRAERERRELEEKL